MNNEVELARGWQITVVRDCLKAADRQQDIVDFISARYSERFLNPILHLNSQLQDDHGYGFAVMALCCLLIETLQCYYSGLPSTFPGDYDKIENAKSRGRLVIENDYAIPHDQRPKRGEGYKVFETFFGAHRILFPGVDGKEFYYNFRNGLLHQAQTFDGWRIKKTGILWDKEKKTVNRTLFANKLHQSFDQLLNKLRLSTWDDDIWVKTRRKVWWIAQLSEIDLRNSD